MKKLCILLALMLPSSAFAASSACDVPKNDFDGLYCLNKVYQQADNDLNKAFQQLNGKLNAEGKAALKSGQRDWIESRNADCSRREDDAFYVNLRCATDTTIERTRFLQDRYRECVSSGCRNSQL